mmetsp:Transcript_21392/g.21718  ORF Transcript_21392/g.21718 Transcript_21392/m.21718 type:complete len:245 (-) Transcript_21392:55-789(-)
MYTEFDFALNYLKQSFLQHNLFLLNPALVYFLATYLTTNRISIRQSTRYKRQSVEKKAHFLYHRLNKRDISFRMWKICLQRNSQSAQWTLQNKQCFIFTHQALLITLYALNPRRQILRQAQVSSNPVSDVHHLSNLYPFYLRHSTIFWKTTNAIRFLLPNHRHLHHPNRPAAAARRHRHREQLHFGAQHFHNHPTIPRKHRSVHADDELASDKRHHTFDNQDGLYPLDYSFCTRPRFHWRKTGI